MKSETIKVQETWPQRLFRLASPYAYAALHARATREAAKPHSLSVTQYQPPPGGGNLFWASLWDAVVWVSLAGGVVVKWWVDNQQRGAGVTAVQIVLGLITAVPLFFALRDRLPGGSVFARLLWAFAYGYGGGTVGGDIGHAL